MGSVSRLELPPSEFDADGVTWRRLLSHTAGLSLGGYPGFEPDSSLPSLPESLSGATNGAGDVRVAMPPGSAFSYSGGGYTLLQLAIEEVSGSAFNDYMRSNVLQRLGASRATYAPTPDDLATMAQGHDQNGRPIPNYQFAATAAAGLHTSLEDLSAVVVALLAGDRPPLSPAIVRMMTTPAKLIDDTEVRYGLGLSVRQGGRVAGYGGANIGWRSQIRFVPDLAQGLVVITNGSAGDEVISAALCSWSMRLPADLGQGQLDQCEARAATASMRRAIVWGVLAAAAALAAALVVLVLRGAAGFAPTISIWRGVLIALVGLPLFGWLVFAYTPLAAWVTQGVWIVRPSLTFLPVGVQTLSSAFVTLGVVILLCTFMARSREES